MGSYLNPGNENFQEALKSEIHVDKSGLIEYTNRILHTLTKYVCVSRPRRFGKSFAADMLTAYYGRGCKSRKLFKGTAISGNITYKKHLNKYDVIYIDVCGFLDSLGPSVSLSDAVDILKRDILSDVKGAYPGVSVEREDLVLYLEAIYPKHSKGFVFIIDEWDAPFRINKNDADGQTAYLRFLNAILKGRNYVALAYMTGILPIKKQGTQSGLNMFKEYTMLRPGPVKEFIGFTEDDVGELCAGTKFTKQDINDWYDGYTLDGLEIYNSNSVVKALQNGRLTNYWTKTEAFDDLLSYIKVDVEGLHDVILKLLAKEKYVFEPSDSFKNDLVSLEGINDYLVALIHLGYLSYDSEHKTLKIPNHEVRIQFVNSLNSMKDSIVAKFYDYSNKLLDATTKADAKGVAEMLGRIFAELTKRTAYPYENAFGDFVDFAYMCANDYYDVIPEAPTRWLKKADFVLYPNLLRARADRPYLPGIIIELKNEKSAEEAADQIEEKGYDDYFEYRKYHGDVIHVGLDFQKMTMKEKKALAERGTAVAEEDGVFVGNDADLDTMAEIVHFCEIRKYTI